MAFSASLFSIVIFTLKLANSWRVTSEN